MPEGWRLCHETCRRSQPCLIVLAPSHRTYFVQLTTTSYSRPIVVFQSSNRGRRDRFPLLACPGSLTQRSPSGVSTAPRCTRPPKAKGVMSSLLVPPPSATAEDALRSTLRPMHHGCSLGSRRHGTLPLPLPIRKRQGETSSHGRLLPYRGRLRAASSWLARLIRHLGFSPVDSSGTGSLRHRTMARKRGPSPPWPGRRRGPDARGPGGPGRRTRAANLGLLAWLAGPVTGAAS